MTSTPIQEKPFSIIVLQIQRDQEASSNGRYIAYLMYCLQREIFIMEETYVLTKYILKTPEFESNPVQQGTFPYELSIFYCSCVISELIVV